MKSCSMVILWGGEWRLPLPAVLAVPVSGVPLPPMVISGMPARASGREQPLLVFRAVDALVVRLRATRARRAGRPAAY